MQVGLLLFLYSYQQRHKPFLIIVYKPSNFLEIQPQVQLFVVSGSKKKHQQTLPVLFFFVLPAGSYKSSMGFLPVEVVVGVEDAFE